MPNRYVSSDGKWWKGETRFYDFETMADAWDKYVLCNVKDTTSKFQEIQIERIEE